MEISETNSEVNSMEENEIKLEFDEFEIDHYGDSSIEFKAKFKNTSTQIMSLQFDYDTQFLAAGTRNGTINIYNLNFCELDSQINPVDETGTIKADVNQNDVKFPVTCLKWKPKSNYSRAVSTLAACYGDGAVKFWDVTKKESKIKIEEKENNGIYSLDYNSTGSILATGGMDSSLRIYDEPTKKLVQIYSPQGCGEILNHYNRIFCVKFHPEDEHIIYSGGIDRMITVHDTRCKFPLRNIIGPYIIGDSIDVRNHSLLTGSYCADECLEIWDLRNYERISAFNWNNSDSPIGGQVVAAKFTKGSTNGIIAASKIENELKMINSTTGEPFESVKGFSSMIYSMDISYEGNYISIGNADGTVSLFEYH